MWRTGFASPRSSRPTERGWRRRFGIDPEDPDTNAVIHGGVASFKSDAALTVLSNLPGWRWVRVLRAVPRPIRDGVYNLVAQKSVPDIWQVRGMLHAGPVVQKPDIAIERRWRKSDNRCTISFGFSGGDRSNCERHGCHGA